MSVAQEVASDVEPCYSGHAFSCSHVLNGC